MDTNEGTVEVNVICYCGHRENVTVDNNAEAVAWAKEDAMERDCTKCDHAREAADIEAYESEHFGE